MGLKIYGVLRSRVTRPIWAAKELGLAYELVPVIQSYRLPDHAAPGAPLNTASPAFLAVNPSGQVPSIDDDGFVLHESLAISLYLVRKQGGPLAPKDERENALMVQWALWAATSVEGKALAIMQNGGPNGDAALRQASIDGLARPLAALDKALAAGGGWLVGGRFTVADINVAEIVRYAQAAPALIDGFPNVKAWIGTCQSRPAFREMMAEREKEPA
jgi:glutathione S-transferase